MKLSEPYSIDNPPEKIKDMPKHAQEIFINAFNAALKQYEGDEERANKVAYAAVKMKYEQDKDGNWITKESEVPMKDELQAKYSMIIQETGKRNAALDSARIKKIVALCQELLSEDEIDEEKVKKAVKEADKTLIWLKEQELVKAEEDIKFPKEAYAYAPSDNIAEWKLRMWEDLDKKITRKQLGAVAAALSPGGLRGQKVEIPKEALSAVKRKIRAAYRSLEVEDEDIPRWVKESEIRTILTDTISLEEAIVTSKGVATIIVIQPGFNSSKERYYPPEVLSRDYGLYEGVKMYADHPTPEDEKARPERSIRDWVATLKNVRIDESGRVVGDAVIVEPWMQQKLASLRDKGMLPEMGISHNSIGTATKGEIEGVKTNVIERIVRVRSVDFVTEPGAGGMVTMFETDKENDVDLINLETLKERRPDLVKSIEVEIKANIIKEVKRMSEQDEKIKELENTNETLTTENSELKEQKAEAEKAQKIAEAKSAIDEAVGKSELPEPSKARILEKFKEAENADGLEEAIKAEENYIAALAEAGKVKGMGDTKLDPEADKKALKEAAKKLHPEYTDAQIETFVEGR